ncbi:MAG: hypothetical protein AAGA70_16560 [Pseudomonadota bacterium]
MAAPVVKILGERNSGTNFLARCLSENFDAKVYPGGISLSQDQRAYLRRAEPERVRRGPLREALWDANHVRDLPRTGGWKHAAATNAFLTRFARSQNALVICIVRHPAAWLAAMHRNPFHAAAHVPARFSAFLRAPWVARPRDELAQPFLDNPAVLYRVKLASYAWLAEVHEATILLRYEDILANPDAAFAPVARHLPRRSAQYTLPQEGTRAFVPGETEATGFAERARRAGYGLLAPVDAAFLSDALRGSFADTLYPFENAPTG